MSSQLKEPQNRGLLYRFGWLPMFPIVLVFNTLLKLKNHKLANDDHYLEHQTQFFSFSKRVKKQFGIDEHARPSDKFHSQRPIVTDYAISDNEGDPLRVLDIATGCGYQAKALRDAGAMEVYGIDIVSERVQEAKRLFPNDGIGFLQMDATKLAFPDNFFDAVTVSCALHDMPPKTKKGAIAEMARVTKPKGNVVIFEPRTFKNKFIGFALGMLGEFLDESLNIKEYVMDDLNPILNEQGLALMQEQNTCAFSLLNIKQCQVKVCPTDSLEKFREVRAGRMPALQMVGEGDALVNAGVPGTPQRQPRVHQ